MSISSRVTVFDYGLGNLYSVCRALEHCGATVELTDGPIQADRIERLLVPGVGAFADCVTGLQRHGQFEAIHSFVATGRPFLGICVGMQMLMETGQEFGTHQGLGLIEGHVEAIPAVGVDGTRLRLPHIGWSALQPPLGKDRDGRGWSGTPLQDVTPGDAVYFVHSFAAVAARPDEVLATYDYGGYPVTAALCRDNVVGVQFHPERSGPVGLRILNRFLAL